MTKHILSAFAAFTGIANSAFGQDIPQNQIPSVILNRFKVDFPRAGDVEWEMEGNRYHVEFETGRSNDHDIWYTASGEVDKHIEEISGSDLPGAILKKLRKDFKEYSTDDVEKVTKPSGTVYCIELDSHSRPDLKVTMDPEGRILEQTED
ncbi:PepSY-like domain-containing protein [Sinomicrobium weinanense]|uniref:PepSY-like domain-containing protein n=1 Tax=Sinomicrobium weinanense TaxID=2842200 RepID=A0A926PZV2_9FLAO|nr:PepSY-like domain-containing protein [Sinomicrobium weinanense]MBC9794452.1 PepSY-like domain-containing protein [Sinomicrobium weinanense]MBU3124359.1 PepSY-like domain-containing protein [Sinomicrobium weinanense]